MVCLNITFCPKEKKDKHCKLGYFVDVVSFRLIAEKVQKSLTFTCCANDFDEYQAILY